MKIKSDIVGNTPKVGDFIVYNPPHYKGIRLVKISDFTKAGCPQGREKDGTFHIVKTNFFTTNIKEDE